MSIDLANEDFYWAMHQLCYGVKGGHRSAKQAQPGYSEDQFPTKALPHMGPVANAMSLLALSQRRSSLLPALQVDSARPLPHDIAMALVGLHGSVASLISVGGACYTVLVVQAQRVDVMKNNAVTLLEQYGRCAADVRSRISLASIATLDEKGFGLLRSVSNIVVWMESMESLREALIRQLLRLGGDALRRVSSTVFSHKSDAHMDDHTFNEDLIKSELLPPETKKKVERALAELIQVTMRLNTLAAKLGIQPALSVHPETKGDYLVAQMAIKHGKKMICVINGCEAVLRLIGTAASTQAESVITEALHYKVTLPNSLAERLNTLKNLFTVKGSEVAPPAVVATDGHPVNALKEQLTAKGSEVAPPAVGATDVRIVNAAVAHPSPVSCGKRWEGAGQNVAPLQVGPPPSVALAEASGDEISLEEFWKASSTGDSSSSSGQKKKKRKKDRKKRKRSSNVGTEDSKPGKKRRR